MTQQSPIPSAVRTTPWLALGALSLATFATVTTELMPSAVLPGMSRDLGVSTAVGGLLVTAWALTIVLTSLLLVRVTATVRRRPLVLAAMGVIAVANVGTALTPTFLVALATRVLGAAAHGVFWAVIVAYAASLVDPSRVGRALAVVLAGPTLSGLVGLPLGAALASGVGWRVVFLGLAVLIVATATVVRTIVPDAPRAASASTGRWDASSVPVLWTAVAGGLVLVGHFAVFTFVAPLAVNQAGDAAVPSVLLALGVGGLVGTVIAGPIIDRWPTWAFPAAAAVFVVTLAALGVTASFWIATLAWGVMIGLFPVALQTRVLTQASDAFRDQAGAVVMTVLNLGLAAGAALGSGTTAAVGVLPLPYIGAAVGALAMIPLLVVPRISLSRPDQRLGSVESIAERSRRADREGTSRLCLGDPRTR